MIHASSSIEDDLSKAIDFLLSEAYYEQVDLFFRFQCCNDIFNNLNKRNNFKLRCLQFLDDFSTNPDSQNIWDLLGQIHYRIIPKSLKSESNEDSGGGRWISNHRTQDKYHIDQIDLFIDLPLELRVLDVLWCMHVGRRINKKLTDNCYANRLSRPTHTKLFRLYFDQYKKWRDTGLKYAEISLETGSSVVLLSMDISRFFYNVDVNWNQIFRNTYDDYEKSLCYLLLRIHECYFRACSPILAASGIEIPEDRDGLLPIGLQSSKILANLSLHQWDQSVVRKLNPRYYGRYVDDMLFVFDNPPRRSAKSIGNIIDNYFIETGILRKDADTANTYILTGMPFKIKSEKLVGTFFDRDHSWAGLKSFIGELRRHNSEFRFLPTDEQGRELETAAFDILMEGSLNKFRSILAVRENGMELSKFLSSEIIAHRLSAGKLSETIRKQLSRFWQGRNLFDFIRLWEKQFTLLFIKHEKEYLQQFWNQTEELILNLMHNDRSILKVIRKDAKELRKIAFANMLSLENQEELNNWVLEVDDFPEDTVQYAAKVRQGHFSRAQYIVWPFLQFSRFNGNLAQLGISAVLEYLARRLSRPLSKFRYIYKDEEDLFTILKAVSKSQPILTMFGEPDRLESKINPEDSIPIKISIPDEYDKGENGITIGVANLRVLKKDIEASYELPHGNPNLSDTRWKELSKLLNLAKKENCDLLILPEVCIPWSWFPLMISYARKQKIGLIFGLEHIVVQKDSQHSVNNVVVAALPYKEDGINQCAVVARTKNYYSPHEIDAFKELDIFPVVPEAPNYHLIHWKGVVFTIFNCYELTDIFHRGVFRGKIDALFAVEWNQDIPYFSNIVESAAIDIHCTIIQANTSEFGDSRVFSPVHGEHDRNIIRVKGGDNITLLKTRLLFDEQREFQKGAISVKKSKFKHTPAGFKYQRGNEYLNINR